MAINCLAPLVQVEQTFSCEYILAGFVLDLEDVGVLFVQVGWDLSVPLLNQEVEIEFAEVCFLQNDEVEVFVFVLF